MTKLQVSRVAEMLFVDTPRCDFARTVTELDNLLDRICGAHCQLVWDCDDVASFDMPGTRILLHYTDSAYAGFAARLVLSVGPSSIPARPGLSLISHAALCARIVARLQSRCQPAELRWHDIAGVVTADEVDQLAATYVAERPRISIFGHRPGATRQNRPQPPELQQLRTALYDTGSAKQNPAAILANQTARLAASLVMMPAAAVHYAADLYRAASS